MKKIIITLLLMLGVIHPAYTFNLNFKSSDEAQIKKVLMLHAKAMDSHDIKAIKTFYDEDYKSADGFDINDFIEMLQKTYNAYENIKYSSKINNISINNNHALVQISDVSGAKIYTNGKKDKEKMGMLKGSSVYNLYMKKNQNNEWKIYKDVILMEETSLKYGVANKIDIDLVTPVMVKSGETYDLSLKMNKPDNIIALGSISREEITYPPKDYPEKFRKIPQEGELERVVTANKKGLDEYAIASIGFTKILMNQEQTKARIEVLGMAYILKRVNMDITRNPKAND